MGFPGGAGGEESTCPWQEAQKMRLGRKPDPWFGKIAWSRKWQNPLQYSCLENPMDRGAWRLQSMGSQRVSHNWACMHAHTHTHTHTQHSGCWHYLPWRLCVSKINSEVLKHTKRKGKSYNPGLFQFGSQSSHLFLLWLWENHLLFVTLGTSIKWE